MGKMLFFYFKNFFIYHIILMNYMSNSCMTAFTDFLILVDLTFSKKYYWLSLCQEEFQVQGLELYLKWTLQEMFSLEETKLPQSKIKIMQNPAWN